MRSSLRFGMEGTWPPKMTAVLAASPVVDDHESFGGGTTPRWRQALPRRSLYAEAFKEAERHKWIESQKQGRDLGESALRDWFREYWPQYCRCKRLEHLEGCQLWEEFEEQDFGQFYSLIISGDLLLDRILDRVHNGMENLDLINWAFDWGLPISRIIDLLTQLDINRARLDPLYDARKSG